MCGHFFCSTLTCLLRKAKVFLVKKKYSENFCLPFSVQGLGWTEDLFSRAIDYSKLKQKKGSKICLVDKIRQNVIKLCLNNKIIKSRSSWKTCFVRLWLGLIRSWSVYIFQFKSTIQCLKIKKSYYGPEFLFEGPVNLRHLRLWIFGFDSNEFWSKSVLAIRIIQIRLQKDLKKPDLDKISKVKIKQVPEIQGLLIVVPKKTCWKWM